MKGLRKTNCKEGFADAPIPMTGAATETVEGLFEFPIHAFGRAWTVRWWFNYVLFVWRERRLAKCILAVALLQDSFVGNCFTD